jgi:hypothetical protein
MFDSNIFDSNISINIKVYVAGPVTTDEKVFSRSGSLLKDSAKFIYLTFLFSENEDI